MDTRITQVIATLNQVGTDYWTTQSMLVDTQAQVKDLTTKLTQTKRLVKLQNIQAIQPTDVLWYEARSANAPKTGPHGTILISVGEPTTADFHPIVLDGKNSDNVYCLRRVYNYLTHDQQAILETAKQFSIGCTVSLNPLSNVQAFEWDYQIRKSSGVVINVGLQLLPDGTLRGFDYVKKDWEQLGPKINLVTATPITIEIDATTDDSIVQFNQVVTNGVATNVTFSHPVSNSIPNSPYINCAYQLDGRADAKPYKATIGFMTATFS